MNEPLPGKKTNILALDVAEPAGQALAAGMALTLALKARRAQKGS